MKQKLNHILKKARPKKGELHSWQGSDEGKKKQKCFSSMSRTHYAFSRRGSKPKSAGWYFVLSSHCTTGNPGSNFSQWACRFMLHPDLLILWFSTMVIPCSCLDAVDLEKVKWEKRKALIYVVLRKNKIGHNLQCTGYRNQKDNIGTVSYNLRTPDL